MSLFKLCGLSYVIILLLGISLSSYGQSQDLPGWKTNTDKTTIELDELKQGGPPKDGIPSIDDPKFLSTDRAQSWITDKEPVIAVEYEGTVRAYPLQVMIWHEIVNDRINGDPLLVTFCPLCYSALVFERTVDGEVLEFGVSGFLRHSDLVMFDRKTETLWQQFIGEAIVGDYVGTTLKQVPSQIISFGQFKENYPDGVVLSKDTGHQRDYGKNPYTGYDDINNTPLFGAGNDDGRLPPMEKVIGVQLTEQQKAYPYSATREEQVINDTIGKVPLLIVHTEGATSAMDAAKIAESKESGSTGVFKRMLYDKELTFTVENGKIVDEQTGSVWTVTGKAVEGEHKGKQLEPVTYGDYFAFAWLVFWPETEIYNDN
ncbi:MAG: DUF3179 domain-containing protein [Bacteroidota bacterium]